MDQQTQETIVTLAQELFAKLETEVQVSLQETQDVLLVQVETPDPGILIGFHGRTLESLQLMLAQMVYKKLGSWTRITVSVGDYRQRREKQLKELALTAAEQVIATGEPMALTDLTPSERRIIHLLLEDHDQVFSESEGEGKDRRLVVKFRQK